MGGSTLSNGWLTRRATPIGKYSLLEKLNVSLTPVAYRYSAWKTEQTHDEV